MNAITYRRNGITVHVKQKHLGRMPQDCQRLVAFLKSKADQHLMRESQRRSLNIARAFAKWHFDYCVITQRWPLIAQAVFMNLMTENEEKMTAEERREVVQYDQIEIADVARNILDELEQRPNAHIDYFGKGVGKHRCTHWNPRGTQEIVEATP